MYSISIPDSDLCQDDFLRIFSRPFFPRLAQLSELELDECRPQAATGGTRISLWPKFVEPPPVTHPSPSNPYGHRQ